ncbi:MAG: hypothetical protein EOO01_12275 [Chitinophagaceae bacterium]|nr:MAG: hypothetical protein EOO01_12275 [Chitinophagaceae bacterium]
MATITAVSYVATTADEAAVKAVGYQVQTPAGDSLTDFLQNEFPNFNLLALLGEIERTFTPLSARPI